MIDIWTTAKNVSVIDRTFGEALKALRPHVPPHRLKALNNVTSIEPTPQGVALVSGAKTVQLLAQSGVVPKGRSESWLRGRVFKHTNGGVYMVTFDPYRADSDPNKGVGLAWDVRLAARWLSTGSVEPVTGVYKWVSSYADLIARIKKSYEDTGKKVFIAGDLETMGLSPFVDNKSIVSISFTMEHNTASLLYTGPKFDDPVTLTATPQELLNQVNWILNSPMVSSRWANGKFDMRWLKQCWGLDCSNFNFDACLVGSLLNENISCSLNTLTKVSTPLLGGYDDSFSATHDKGHFELVPPDDTYLKYAGGDTDATQQVSDVLRDKLLKTPALARFYTDLLHPAARVFEKIEHRGILVDVDKFKTLEQDLNTEIKQLHKECIELLPARIRLKHLEKIESQLELGKNPLTPAIKGDYFFGKAGLNLKPKMFTEKTGAVSTAAKHFEMFGGYQEAVDMADRLKRVGVAEKTLSTYVHGFLKHLGNDGRVHPSYFLFHGAADIGGHEGGTVTGRLSAVNPAIQTLPKHSAWAKRLRECYPAPDGYMVFEADFSQGELRVAACVAPDSKMIAAYKEGMDLHAVTGALAAHVDYSFVQNLKKSDSADDRKEAKRIRQGGKAGNFGLIYGMQANGFMNYARDSYGVHMTLKEANDFRNKFLYEQWTGLPKYHDRAEKLVKAIGSVKSPLGRVRHLPQVNSWDQEIASKAVRQAINSPIQSCLSDMMIYALIEIESTFDEGDLCAVAVIHDAAIGYVRKEKAVDLVEQVTQIMESLDYSKFGWSPELTFPADWSLGDHMGAMYEKDDFLKLQV